MGIEPTSSAWKAEVIAIIRCPHLGTRLPDISVDCSMMHGFRTGAAPRYLAALGPNLGRRFSPSPHCAMMLRSRVCIVLDTNLVVGEGFEPSKSVTADLQSAPFGRSGTPPDFFWCRQKESNPRPTDYKSVALPTELCRHQVLRILGRADDLCNKKIA